MALTVLDRRDPESVWLSLPHQGTAKHMYRAGLQGPGQQRWPALPGTGISRTIHHLGFTPRDSALLDCGQSWECAFTLKQLFPLPMTSPPPPVPPLKNIVLGGGRQLCGVGFSAFCVCNPLVDLGQHTVRVLEVSLAPASQPPLQHNPQLYTMSHAALEHPPPPSPWSAPQNHASV